MRILLVILFLCFSAMAQSYSGCLPEDIKASEVVSAKQKGMKNGQPVIEKITVKQTLKKLKAKCKQKKLLDSKGKEIRFYRLQGCWGNPPADYLEIMANQQKELAELKRKYSVIEINCNSSGYQSPESIQ